MQRNGFELQVMAQYKMDELRRSAESARAIKRLDHQPRLRIAVAHALIALGNQIWREDVAAAEVAPRKAALT